MEALPPVGESTRLVFLLRCCDLLQSRQGQSYLSVEVVCPAAAIQAVVWEHVEVLADMLKIPQLIEATVKHNEKGYQLSEIKPLDNEDYDIWDYLPRTSFDEEKLWEVTRVILRERVTSEGFKELLENLLEDEKFVAQYRRAPAALTVHHPYRGGLMEHVLNGLESLPTLAQLYDVSEEMVTLGFWLHDIGKLWEIDMIKGRYTREGELIGHLAMGVSWLSEKMNAIEAITEAQKTQLLHILVSHHGSVDKGSPKPPMSKAALLVHTLDQLDSQMFQISKDLKDVSEDSFSHRNPLLGRKSYNPSC